MPFWPRRFGARGRPSPESAWRLSYTKALTSTLLPHSTHSRYSFRSFPYRMACRVLLSHLTQLPSTASSSPLVSPVIAQGDAFVRTKLLLLIGAQNRPGDARMSQRTALPR